METPFQYSLATKRWLLRLVSVQNAAVDLATTGEENDGKVTVFRPEFNALIRAINHLMQFEDRHEKALHDFV